MSNVANHELGVTSTTSEQVLSTDGPADVCLDPSKKVPTGHENVADVALAVDFADRTEATLGPIIRVQDKVADPSDPLHPDTGGGINSGTYAKPAVATDGAPDVRVEAKKPARKDDPTDQNEGNAKGTVKPKEAPRQATIGPNDQLLEDTLIAVWVTCGHKRTSLRDDGTYLAWFECYGGETLTLEAKRGNARPPNKKGAPGKAICHSTHKSKGAEWIVKRQYGADPKSKDKEQRFQGDKIELGGKEWLTPEDGVISSLLDGNSTTFSAENKQWSNEAKAWRQRGVGKNLPASTQKAFNDYWQPRHEAADAQANQARMNAATGIQTVARVGIGVAQAVKFWKWATHPLTLVIEGMACSGSKTITVRAYPAAEFEVNVGELLANLKKVAEVINGILSFLKALLTGVGFGSSFDGNVKICTETSVKFEFAFKELDEDKVMHGQKLLKQAVGREYKVVIETAGVARNPIKPPEFKSARAKTFKKAQGKLLGFEFVLRCSLLKLLTLIGVPPHIIDKVEGWLRKWKVKADLELNIDFGLGMKLEVGFDKYEGLTGSELFVQAIMSIFFGAKLQIGNFEVTCGFVIEWTPGIKTSGPLNQRKSWNLLKLDLDRLKAGITAVAQKTVFGFAVEFGDTWYPDWLTVVMGEIDFNNPLIPD